MIFAGYFIARLKILLFLKTKINNQTLRKSGGSVALIFKSEREVLFEHLFHSAVHYGQGVYGILPFIFGAVYRLFHESALFKAGIVMDGEIILEQEATVADISHLADEPELLAYRVDGNASEILYRINKRFSLVFWREH